MEKIKSALSGHKKNESGDATHDAPTSSSTATGEQHPIYDEFTGKKGTGKEGTLTAAGGPYAQVQTTSGEPYVALAQPGSSIGHGHGHEKQEHVGTDGAIGAAGTTSGAAVGSSSHTTGGPLGSSDTTREPIGSSNTTREPVGGHSTTSGSHLRPDANPTGREGLNTGISDASIKSGVIGFGAGERQEHAALPTHNPTSEYMDRNQVVGGGDPGTAGMTEGQYLKSGGAQPPSGHEQTTGQQPYEHTLRQQSYTADTDRSFPLAGGVASRQPQENTPLTQQRAVGEQDPLIRENDPDVHKGHGKEELAGAAAAGTAGGLYAHHHNKEKDEHAAPTQHETHTEKEPKEKKTGILGGIFSRDHKDKDEHTSPAQHKTINERELGTREAGVHDDHDREKLAGAAAAGTAAGGGLYAHHHNKDKDENVAPTQHKTTTEQEPKEKKTGILGGIFSRDHKDKDEHTSPSQYDTTTQREPRTTEQGAGVHDNHDREKLAGAAAAGTAGGLYARHQHEHNSPTQHNTISEREPGTKEREVGVPESYGREGLPGVAAGGVSSREPHDYTSSTQHQPISGLEPGREREVGSHEGHGREGLAGAATLATGVGASKALHHSQEKDIKDQGLETRQATYGDVPPATYQGSNTTGGLPGSATHHHNPEALAAATAAASKSQGPGYGTQDRSLPGASQATSSGPTSGSFGAGAVSGERPQGTRSASHRHIPGEFLNTPTPGDESRTFLDYHPVIAPTSGANVPSGQSSTLGPSSTTDAPLSQHELRHTGSLEQPQSKSSDIPGEHQHDEHHYGRDAALAGGLGAGAAGLGYAASQKHEPSDAGSGPLYAESSPYSSKPLDPRALGTKANLEQQRSDPQAKSETLPHHAAQTSNPTGFSAASGPAASHGTAKSEDPQHHYGRDAALVGAGAATAGGLHHELQRNDTPGTGTAGLPRDSSYASQPLSSSSAPQQSSTTSAGSYPQQRSTGNDVFYGAAGAPAPIVDRSTQQQQPLSNLGHTSTSGPTAAAEKDPQHHYGRDAALAGAGAATAGGLYAANRNNETETGPASKTIGQHDSNIANILDPRVKPDPSKQAHHSAGPTDQDPASRTIGHHDSNIANILDPRVKPDPSKQKANTATGPQEPQQGEHHYGRDAAVVGGTGAAGYGAYEAAKAYDGHRSTQPGAAMGEQRYDTTAPGATTSNPVPTQGQYNYNDPSTTSHANRNAALGTGAGLGAAGVGAAAYEHSKHGDNTRDLPLHQKQDFASSGAPGSLGQSGPTQAYNTHTQDRTGYQGQDPTQEKHHDKRDAALLAGGAAAAGGGAYAYSQHEEAERERARLEKEQQERLKKEAHDREKEQHRLDKEQHKHEKDAAKHEKEQHKHEKEIAALEAKHEKDIHAQEKEQHRLEKEQYKQEKEAEKEARKEQEGEEKKKGGLLGFLHRDKSKKEKNTSSPESSPRHSKEYAAGALGAGTTAAAYEEEQRRNRLHKDPPPGHPAREALEHQHQHEGVGKREHVGVDGPIGDPNLISGDRETKKGVFGAHDIHDTTGTNQGYTSGNTADANVVGGHQYAPGTATTSGTTTAPTAGTAGHYIAPGHQTEPAAVEPTVEGFGLSNAPDSGIEGTTAGAPAGTTQAGHQHAIGHHSVGREADTEGIRKGDTLY